jgi:branched-chain amino acid transport system ATP-binding protein
MDSSVTTAAPLSVTDVAVSFSGVKALSGITFDIPGGGISAVIGPNGAGKTTLFNCISGLTSHKGRISLGERDLSALSAHQRALAGVARTFQTPLVIPGMTALQNVLVGGHGRLKPAAWASVLRTGSSRRNERLLREDAMDLLGRLGIPHVAHLMVDSLPHGDRRRIEVARALIAYPSLLLLDEPAAGLGADEANDLLAVIAEHAAATGMTTILVEHDVALVMRVAPHVVVLDAGRLLAKGKTSEVATNPKVIAAYLGDDYSELAR